MHIHHRVVEWPGVRVVHLFPIGAAIGGAVQPVLELLRWLTCPRVRRGVGFDDRVDDPSVTREDREVDATLLRFWPASPFYFRPGSAGVGGLPQRGAWSS